MPNDIELLGGSPIHCSDGSWGILGWLALDPASMHITHIAVEGRVLREYGQLVPADLLLPTTDGVLLACSLAEIDRFPPAEAPAAYGRGAIPITQLPGATTQLSADTHVYGTDGDFGELLGVAVDAEDHRLTRVYLSTGHFTHKRTVTIPAGVVQSVESAAVHVALNRGQLEQL